MGYNQLINRVTRIESGKLLDHIYVRNAAGNDDVDDEAEDRDSDDDDNDDTENEDNEDEEEEEEEQQEMILESGNIRCGISDHDLIYCTVRYQNREQIFPAVEAAARFVRQHTPQNVIQRVFAAINERTQGNNNILEGSLFLPYAELLAADMHRLRTACENAVGSHLDKDKVLIKKWKDIRKPFQKHIENAGYRDTKAAWLETGIDEELEDVRGFNFWKVKMYVHKNIIQNPGPQPLEDDDQRHVVHLTKKRQNFINDFQRLIIGNP